MATGVLLKSTKSTFSSLQCLKNLTARTFTTQLNAKQQEIQQLTQQFADEVLKPEASKLDKEGRFPFEHIKKLTNMGLMGACVDEKYGGLGLDYLSLAIAVEEISRGCASTGMIVSIHNFLYANLVNEKGTEEQKEMFLREFTKGAIGCFALSEPGAGTDVASIRTYATAYGDYYVLNGKKSWVTSSVEGTAATVFATLDPELRHRGIACFLVPMDAEGVFRGNKEPIIGVRAATACNMSLDEVRIPKGYLVGEENEGFKIAMEQLDQGRIGIAAHAVGIAQAALDTAINYAKERQAFGKPLSRLPSVKDRLTDMCILVEKARLCTYGSKVMKSHDVISDLLIKSADRLTDMCILVETARLCTYRAATARSTKHSAMAKYVSGRAAAAAADHCVQILGGRGLSTNYAAERHFRDARGTQIYGGVTDIQKRLIGHYLLKEHDAL